MAVRKEVQFNITTHSDDWDNVDGIPRWVWRLDNECARLASHGEDMLTLVPQLCIAYIEVYQLHRHTNNPKGVLADWLLTCRPMRNKIDIGPGEQPQ